MEMFMIQQPSMVDVIRGSHGDVHDSATFHGRCNNTRES